MSLLLFSLLSNRYVKPIGRRERHHDVCYLFQIDYMGRINNERANDSLFPQTCFLVSLSPGKKKVTFPVIECSIGSRKNKKNLGPVNFGRVI